MKRSSDRNLKGLLLGFGGAVVLIWLGWMLLGHLHGVHRETQPIQNGFDRHSFGMRNFYGHGTMMMNGHSVMETKAAESGWALNLIKIAFVLLGLIMWSYAKRTLKWFGAAVFAIGLFTLLPLWLAAVVTAFIAYIYYRIQRNKVLDNTSARPVVIPPMAPVDRQPDIIEVDMLDEWERKIKKEEN